MDRRIALVTGATFGLGEVTARELARQGLHVVVVGRSQQRLDEAGARIRAVVPDASLDAIVADLSVIAEAKRAALTFRAKYDRLDVLVNNAGAIYDERQLSRDGLELTFALNHMGYFVLTHHLLEVLEKTGTPARRARIVNLSSGAHQMARRGLDFEDLGFERRRYTAMASYGASKLMNLYFTYELARRLAARGVNVTVNAAHPGAVASGFAAGYRGLGGALFRLFRPLMRTPEKGAETQLWLATSPQVEGVSGKYFASSREARSSAVSHDPAAQARLWQLSETLMQKHGGA